MDSAIESGQETSCGMYPYQSYLDYRGVLIASGDKECTAFDTAIITLSATAFGLLTLLPSVPRLASVAVACFGFALIAVLASRLTSFQSMRRQVEILDESYQSNRQREDEPRNQFSLLTLALNWASPLSFAAGVGSLMF